MTKHDLRYLKGWRWIQGKKVYMTPLKELRFLARGINRPNSSPYQREVGKWAVEEIRKRYPNEGVFKPRKEEEDV